MDDVDARYRDPADELAALRMRAYSADADIAADPVALARLIELEDRDRGAHIAHAANAGADEDPHSHAAAESEAADTSAPAAADEASSAPARPRLRTRVGLYAAASLAIIALAGAVWTQQAPASAPEAIPPFTPIAGAPTPDVNDPSVYQQEGASSAADFTTFLDELRDEVLAGADLQGPAGRIVRAELRPYGGSNGWSSWAGPTIDNQICLVVSDGGLPIVTCDTPENVASGGVSTIVTAGQADSRGDAGFAPGTKVRITLLPGAVATEPYTGE